MSFSWGGTAAPSSAQVGAPERARLEQVADELIPEAHGMPSASAVGVGREQLDIVLTARADLLEPLQRALATPIGDELAHWLAALEERDPDAHHAVVLVVLAGYYLSDVVMQKLGYPGQTPKEITASFPEYVVEGLLDPVVERGPLYREPPEDSSSAEGG